METRPQFSPNKRAKTLIPDANPPSPMCKGKSKIDEGISLPGEKEMEDDSGDCCGICLSENGGGGVSRGYIDSCSHYFCFLCIMEWAKVESKCPLCKRRFSTIRRPPKPPVFAYERVVRVPVRDQVYHYFGNVSTGPPDPYSESKCSVCHGISDESLLLLCDLCDTAAHTYCVGLGTTVPEGDWFCQDCTLLKDEQLKSETDTVSTTQIRLEPIQNAPSNDEHISVFDIIRETCEDPAQKNRSTFPENSTANINKARSRSTGIVTEHSSKANARTLQHCRGVHDRIRVMRQNWNGFRTGVVDFSSSPCVGNVSTQKSVGCTTGHQSCINQQPSAQCSSSHTGYDIGVQQEIEKAWKMMDRAKSIKQRIEKSNTARHHSKKKSNAAKKTDCMTSIHPPPDSQKNVPKNFGSIGIQLHGNSLGKCSYNQPSEKHKSRECAMVGGVNFCEGPMTAHLPRHQEPGSSSSAQLSSVRSTGNLHSERPACLSSFVMSELVGLNADLKGISVDHRSSSISKLKQPMEKRELKKISVDHQKYSDAKSEIQSLVKFNLKLQTEAKKLEVDTFKELARLATHSILSACDLELPKPGSCSVPDFSCPHPDEVKLQKNKRTPKKPH